MVRTGFSRSFSRVAIVFAAALSPTDVPPAYALDPTELPSCFNRARDAAGALILAEVTWPRDVSYVELTVDGRRVASLGQRCREPSCLERYAAISRPEGRSLLVERAGRYAAMGAAEWHRAFGLVDSPPKAALRAALAGYSLPACTTSSGFVDRVGAAYRVRLLDLTLRVDARGAIRVE